MLACQSCDYKEERTIAEEDLRDFNPPKCPKCDSSTSMEVEDKTDFIDDISDLAEKTGCKIELISLGSEEGDSLYSAFGGIAGILRYSVDI